MKLQRIFCITSVLILIFIKTNFAQAPNWVWAKSAGSISNDYSNATCTDANGNVYITGTFQGSSITFGSYTLHNVSTGTLDIFVVKYDSNGNVLWAKSGGGISDDYVYGICADANDNVCITGYFNSDSISFGGASCINVGCTDVFVTKFDASGNVLWAKSIGGKRCEYSYGICSDANSNVYITGMFSSDTLIVGTDTLRRKAQYDGLIASYDAGGNVRWAKAIGGSKAQDGIDNGQSICTDASGYVYVTGFLQSIATFGSDTIFGHGNADVFVAKFDNYGNKIWAKSAIGPNDYGTNIGTGITVDAESNVYITGFFEYSIAFSDTLANSGTYSIFTAKYDSNGNAIWGRCPGGTGYDYGTGICSDAGGNVFITGYFASSFLNFGGFPVLNSNVGYNDIYVAGYDSHGNALWAKSVGGQDYDYGMGISREGGSVYVTGYFGSYSLTFGSTTITNTGSYDIFLAKLSSLVGINENHIKEGSLVVYPNPTTGIVYIATNKNIKNGHIIFYNSIGEIVYSDTYEGEVKTIDITLKEGIYFLRLTSESETQTMKLVKQ